MPVVGNFGGDRKDEVGIRRLGSTDFLLRSAQNTEDPPVRRPQHGRAAHG